MPNLDESLLAPLPPFSRLSRPEIREILDRATPSRYPEGTAIFGEGLPAERFFLLLDGFVRHPTPELAVLPLDAARITTHLMRTRDPTCA